jgi:hypothetical protein
MIQLPVRPTFSWCHGLGKHSHKNVHDQLWALPLFHAFDTESPNVTCRSMFPLTPSLYIYMCSSSCISWFHPKSNIFNVLSYLYRNFTFFTQNDHSEEIHGIMRQGAPLHVVSLDHGPTWRDQGIDVDASASQTPFKHTCSSNRKDHPENNPRTSSSLLWMTRTWEEREN